MKYQLRPLDMSQKAVAKAGSLRSSLDQTGNVRDNEGPVIAEIDHAKVGFERCERIVSDLWFCCRNDRDQCRLSRIWKAYQADVCYQLQLKLQLFFLAGPALIVKFWRSPRRRSKMSVAPASF